MGRHKKNRDVEPCKDYMFRVRMDKETLKKLDDLSNKLNLSRSEVARLGIEELHNKQN